MSRLSRKNNQMKHKINFQLNCVFNQFILLGYTKKCLFAD